MTGGPRVRGWIRAAEPLLRRIYPFMVVALAYVLPTMHQSSLGALMRSRAGGVHPLWQTPWLRVLYLHVGVRDAALPRSSSRSMTRLSLLEAADRRCRCWPSSPTCSRRRSSLWLALRFADVAWRHQLGAAFAFDSYSLIFLAENLGLVLRRGGAALRRLRETPRVLYNMATLAVLASLLYRFAPTTSRTVRGACATSTSRRCPSC